MLLFTDTRSQGLSDDTDDFYTYFCYKKRRLRLCGCSYFIVIAMCRNYIAKEEENLCNLNHFTSIEKRIGFAQEANDILHTKHAQNQEKIGNAKDVYKIYLSFRRVHQLTCLKVVNLFSTIGKNTYCVIIIYQTYPNRGQRCTSFK